MLQFSGLLLVIALLAVTLLLMYIAAGRRRKTIQHKLAVLARCEDTPELREIMNERPANIDDLYIQARANANVYHQPAAAQERWDQIFRTFMNEPGEVIYLEAANFDTMLENLVFDMRGFTINATPIADDLRDIYRGFVDPTDHHVHSDPQNVHDSNVQDTLAKKYDRIKSLNGMEHMVGIDDFLMKHSDDISGAAHSVIAKIVSNYEPIYRLGSDLESDVFANVWSRINSPANKASFDQLKKSFIENLENAVENGQPVCVGGRTARLLDSLSMFDCDPIVGEQLKTYDLIKKEILDRAHVILTNIVATLPDDERNTYEHGKLDDPQLPAIELKLKQQLGKELHEEYKNIVESDRLAGIIADATYAI